MKNTFVQAAVGVRVGGPIALSDKFDSVAWEQDNDLFNVLLPQNPAPR